jgi:hypothetical protein
MLGLEVCLQSVSALHTVPRLDCFVYLKRQLRLKFSKAIRHSVSLDISATSVGSYLERLRTIASVPS